MDESDLRMDQRVRKSTRETLRESFITGLAVVVPMLVTVIVLAVAFQYVYDYLSLFAQGIVAADEEIMLPVIGDIPVGVFVIQLVTPVILLVIIMVVGIFTNTTKWGERAVDYFDYFISQIPAVGGVYDSFRQMSDVMLESDTQSFRDVKLVEFPHEGAYTLGFVTTETPSSLSDPAGHAEMLTLFLPLAPNPVMGGHLVHMPADRVMDVEMTVEEGIRAIVTSGVAVAGSDGATSNGMSEEQLRDLAGVEHADQQFDPEKESPSVRRSDPVSTERPDTYDESVEPARATTPDDIARRERPEAEGPAADADTPAERAHGVDTDDASVTPAEEAGRYANEADSTEQRPAEMADRAAENRESTEERPAEMADRAAKNRESTEERPAEMADREERNRESTEARPAALADREETDRDDTEQRPAEEANDDRGGRN
ncbi:hypothetical protein JCM30237_00400 [Halolamina litorea]|uniref:DUF502 domain-containing protein n=1 Tax=Halolamina litorea TaxID=1515593 RepID=A0ABD6BSP8_9EURY|nr:DUF502 domain-containing protein [Halolamina litorea]